ncbi:hypothetical protein BDF14DRAFT_1778209 [Spinellus fusiger]|nr:hypothetical protein BDF14DRAFT_1778209 [Spinellus fusiger]
MPHTKEDATLTLHIDPSFTGIITGFANDESEGCTLKGICVADVHRPVKVRRLLVWLEGRCKVNLKSTSYGVPGPETSERRTLFTKDARFVGDDGQILTLQPGKYTYPFSFELPAVLPCSFRGKRGYIRYRLQASMHRTLFANDIHVAQQVELRRCLMSDITSLITNTETTNGTMYPNKLKYSATAPTMVYREGGLIRLNVAMAVVCPETQSVHSVTCALRERVEYRTTDQHSNTIIYKTDDIYPLGHSTFYPSQATDYNAAEQHNYNAVFRVCTRVNADTNCRLIKVTHALIVNITVHDTTKKDEFIHEKEECEEIEGGHSGYTSEDERYNTKQSESLPSPPDSRPSSPSLSRSSSSSSISSIFRRSTSFHSHSQEQQQHHEPLFFGNIKKQQRRLHGQEGGESLVSSTCCSMELPLIVTSREYYWDGDMPSPPAYGALDVPPSYGLSIEQLPPAPIYPDNATITADSS